MAPQCLCNPPRTVTLVSAGNCACFRCAIGSIVALMQIAKPLLLVSTPIGVLGGLHEAWRLVGGLAFLIVVMLGILSFAATTVVVTIRREQRARGDAP